MYARVADRLRARILSGELAPGQQLDSESALAEQLGVSRATVRGALEVLQHEGHITKQQGARSVVMPVRVTQAMAELATLDETLLAQGLASSTKILRYSFETAPGPIATALELSEGGEILSVRRLHSVQSEPIALVDLAIDAQLAADLTRRDIEEHPFFDLLPAKTGVRLGRASQRVRAEAASPEDAELLGLAPGSPVLVCERLTLSDTSRPLVHAVFRYHGDRFELQSSMTWHERRVTWALPGLAPTATAESIGESA